MAKQGKQQMIEKCRQSLVTGGISFREFSNGHFRVFKPGHHTLLDFWATTGKFKLADWSHFEEGHDKLGMHIRRAYGRDTVADKAAERAEPVKQAKAANTTGTNGEVPW